jgi:acyl carrier protein
VPTESDLWKTVSAYIGAVKPTVDPSKINPQASLTADIGLDSLDLVELASRIGAEFPQCDIMPWLTEASSPGKDTVGTFVAHLERQLAEAATPGTAAIGGTGAGQR